MLNGKPTSDPILFSPYMDAERPIGKGRTKPVALSKVNRKTVHRVWGTDWRAYGTV